MEIRPPNSIEDRNLVFRFFNNVATRLNKINKIAPLNITIDDPPTATQVKLVVDKLNEIIASQKI